MTIIGEKCVDVPRVELGVSEELPRLKPGATNYDIINYT